MKKCAKCNGTGLCPRCNGMGCMDCGYDGDCKACAEERFERDREIEEQFVRSRSHGRWYNRRQSEYFD